MIEYTIRFHPDYVKTPMPGLSLYTKALRSGKFPQGHGRLRNGDKFCCAGVHSHIHGRLKDVWRKDVAPLYCDLADGISGGSNETLSRSNPDHSFFVIPNNVQIEIYGDKFDGDEIVSSFYTLNDSGLTFSQIADIFEALYEDAPPHPNLNMGEIPD